MTNETTAQVAVPEGWKLVPLKPTDAMLTAGYAMVQPEVILCPAWDAMLAAAPTPPAQQPVAVLDEPFAHDNKTIERLLNAAALLVETPCPDSGIYFAACLADMEELLAPPAQQSQSDEIEELRGSIRTFMDLLAHGAPIKGQVDVMARLVGWDGFQNVEQRAPGDTAAPELARHQLSAEDLAHVREAAKDGLSATTLASGAVAFLNDGSEPDYSHPNCPACDGSGHIDDVQAAAPAQAEQLTVTVLRELKDGEFRDLVNDLRDIASQYHATEQLRERISHALRSALLVGGV